MAIFNREEKSHLRDTPYVKTQTSPEITVAGKKVAPVATYMPAIRTRNTLNKHGFTPVLLHEIRDPHAYNAAISAGTNPFTSSVELKSPEELSKHRMFVTSDGLSGGTLHGDYVGGAFNHNPNTKGFAHSLVPLLIQEGGRRGDAFDTILPHIYAEHGLHTTARLPFNDEYAPKNWNYSQYAKYNNGRPDVVLMSYQHKNYADYTPGQGESHNDYDTASEVMNSSVKHPTPKRSFSDVLESWNIEGVKNIVDVAVDIIDAIH